MKNNGEQLYQTMMADILYCRQKNLDQDAETECCFQITNNDWEEKLIMKKIIMIN